ncbi:hypothetical protein ACFL5W_02150 [Thermodesulfobacteriota bacterium]
MDRRITTQWSRRELLRVFCPKFKRITDIPYIIEKHDELNPDIFKREPIGSLSNCIACHTTAEKGIYENDNVKIPQ